MTESFTSFTAKKLPTAATLQAMQSVAKRFNEHLNSANEAYLDLQELCVSEEMSASIGSELGLDWDFMELMMSGLSLEEATVRHHLQGREGEVVVDPLDEQPRNPRP